MLQLQSISRRTYTRAKEQCSTKTEEDIEQRELQAGTLAWIHLNLLNIYGVSKAFNLDDLRRHEGNAELRTILFKEGGNDTIMDSLQSETKQEEHNCINALAKPIEPTELADFCLKIKKGHIQNGLHMNMKTWQGQERTKGSLPTATKQNRGNRRLDLIPQAAEQAEH